MRRKLKVTVNNVVYDVVVEDTEGLQSENQESKNKVDIQNEKVRDESENLNDNEVIKAPIAGTVLSIEASVGDKLKKGQVILILEAMKMENEIVVPRDCEIVLIKVNKGQNVDAGTPLVFFK